MSYGNFSGSRGLTRGFTGVFEGGRWHFFCFGYGLWAMGGSLWGERGGGLGWYELRRDPSRSKDALRMTARTGNDEEQATAKNRQRQEQATTENRQRQGRNAGVPPLRAARSCRDDGVSAGRWRTDNGKGKGWWFGLCTSHPSHETKARWMGHPARRSLYHWMLLLFSLRPPR